MQKIKILTDSACDIDKNFEDNYNIKIMNFPVTLEDKSYRERADFSIAEFYDMMDAYPEIPKTAQITAYEYTEEFKSILKEGYTDVILITISSTGSNTYNSALMAKEQFAEEVENASELNIHIIDSKNYTGAYGYPIMQSALKLQKGATAEEIIGYLEEWFECVAVYFAPYTLKYVKRSGRLSAVAAFAGEILGLRPIIKIINGVSSVVEKVRGDKNIIPKLVATAEKNMTPQTPYIIITGSSKEYSDELEKEMTKKFGYPPEWTCQIGAAVACNAGHKVIGIIIREKKNG